MELCIEDSTLYKSKELLAHGTMSLNDFGNSCIEIKILVYWLNNIMIFFKKKMFTSLIGP